MILEPIYETDFSDYSFGFRPNRRTHDAIRVVEHSMYNGAAWVIDADIKGFFDNVDHGKMGKIIQDRITDRKVLKLIWKFLKSGVMENGTYRHSTLGTPQGGIVSPLLANVYLNELDQWAKAWTETSPTENKRRKRRGRGHWVHVRYADDFLMLTRGAKRFAEEMRDRVGKFVNEELNLTLSEKKTDLTHAEDGIEFLGYELQKIDGSWGIQTGVPKKAVVDVKEKIDAATKGDTDVSVKAKMKALNAVLRGWAEYYKYANDASSALSKVENYSWHRVTHWLGEKFECSRRRLISRKVERKRPLTINGISLEHIGDKSAKYTESPMNKDHPYLEGEPEILDIIPEDDPWLANVEDRTGFKDRRFDALQRDEWMCQRCGTDLNRRNAEVHHKRARTGYENHEDADRLGNLVSLCVECHKQIESNRTYAEESSAES